MRLTKFQNCGNYTVLTDIAQLVKQRHQAIGVVSSSGPGVIIVSDCVVQALMRGFIMKYG